VQSDRAYNPAHEMPPRHGLMRSWSTPVKLAAAALCALLLSMPAAAQLRTVPSGADRGVLSHVSGMMFELNGERIQMGSGAQIRDASNRIILPGMLPPESLVKYTLDHEGHIHRVWILTPEEAARPDEEKK